MYIQLLNFFSVVVRSLPIIGSICQTRALFICTTTILLYSVFRYFRKRLTSVIAAKAEHIE